MSIENIVWTKRSVSIICMEIKSLHRSMIEKEKISLVELIYWYLWWTQWHVYHAFSLIQNKYISILSSEACMLNFSYVISCYEREHFICSLRTIERKRRDDRLIVVVVVVYRWYVNTNSNISKRKIPTNHAFEHSILSSLSYFYHFNRRKNDQYIFQRLFQWSKWWSNGYNRSYDDNNNND